MGAPGAGNPRPDHVSRGNLVTGVALGLSSRSPVLAWLAHAKFVTRRVNSWAATEVFAAFGRWPAVEVRRNWPWPHENSVLWSPA